MTTDRKEDLRPDQPSTEQSTGSLTEEQAATAREDAMLPRHKLLPKKKALKFSSRRLSKEPLPVLLEEEEDVSSQGSPQNGTSGLQRSSSHDENTDGDSPKSASHALVNESLHSRNTSLVSTVFSGVENHSGTNTPTSPITPPKVNHKVIPTNVQTDGLLASTNALPSIFPACFTTPHGTIKTDLPGGWLETRDHHEDSIDEYFPETSPDNSIRDTYAEFLEDAASSFLSKKLSGPFCWVEIGIHQYMTVWDYARGHFDPTSHHGFKVLKEDLCYDKSKSVQQAALPTKDNANIPLRENADVQDVPTGFQDVKLDRVSEGPQPDSTSSFVADLPLELGEPSGDIGKTTDETMTSKEEQDPAVSNSVDLHGDCASSKNTHNEQGEGHGLAHVFVGHLQKENFPKEESGDAMIHQPTADPKPATLQEAGKEEQAILAAPKASQMFVGHPRPLLLRKTKKEKKVRDANTPPTTTNCDKLSENTQDAETSNAKSSCISSDETTIPYCNLHSDSTRSLSHVFPWLTSSEDEQVIDEPKAGLSNIPAEDDSSPSIQKDSNKEEISYNSSNPESYRASISQAPEIPYCNLQVESTHGLCHVFPWLTSSQDIQEEDEPEAESLSNVPAEDEKSALPYCNLQTESTHGLSHVFPWLTSDQDEQITDEPEAGLPCVPTEDETLATPYSNLRADATHGLSHVFPWLTTDEDAQLEVEPKAGLSCAPYEDETPATLCCNLPADTTHGLAHVFVGHPWLNLADDEKVEDEPTGGLSCKTTESDLYVSTQHVSNDARDTAWSDAQVASNDDETSHDLSHVFPWLIKDRDEEVEIEPEAEQSSLNADNDSSLSAEDDISEHREIECGSSHVFVDHPLSKTHQEDDEPGAGPPSDNDASTSTEYGLDYEEPRYPLSHVFVGHKWLASQDADNEESYGGEDVDPCLSYDFEDMPAPVEDCNDELPFGPVVLLQEEYVQQADDVKATAIYPIEGLAICQSIGESRVISSGSQANTVATEVCYHSHEIKTQELVLYSGATNAQTQLRGPQSGQIELDEIDPVFYSVRQLLNINRSAVNIVKTADVNLADTVEDSPGREVVLRTLFLENSADAKVAEFIRLPGTVKNSGGQELLLRSISLNNTAAMKVVEFILAKKHSTATIQDENLKPTPQATEGSVQHASLVQEVAGSGKSSEIQSDSYSNVTAEESNSADAVFFLIFYILILWVFW